MQKGVAHCKNSAYESLLTTFKLLSALRRARAATRPLAQECSKYYTLMRIGKTINTNVQLRNHICGQNRVKLQ